MRDQGRDLLIGFLVTAVVLMLIALAVIGAFAFAAHIKPHRRFAAPELGTTEKRLVALSPSVKDSLTIDLVVPSPTLIASPALTGSWRRSATFRLSQSWRRPTSFSLASIDEESPTPRRVHDAPSFLDLSNRSLCETIDSATLPTTPVDTSRPRYSTYGRLTGPRPSLDSTVSLATIAEPRAAVLRAVDAHVARSHV